MSQMYCYGCMRPKNNTPICEHCGFDDRKRNEVHQLPMGTLLQNQYVIGRVLGQGGFGITYIGWDRNLAIPVAIKEYFPSGTVHRQSTVNIGVTCYTGEATEAFVSHRERFLKEARTLAQLSGLPEIVQVRNFFTANNTAYIVMEYVQGITLKGYLRKLGRRMTVQEVLDVMKPVLKALSKVHSKNLIHRDISPDNIMLPDGGGVKLIDFGTVRNMDSGMQTKSTESILKPGFAPIEQYQTKGNLGTWTDVYALCASIHYCMTGKIPEDALERLENGGALVHLKSVPGIPPKVLSALEKGLAVRIADRIQTVDDLYEMLYGESPVTGVVHSYIPQNQPQANPTAFAEFRGAVPDQILNYCESVAHKPVLVETYLNQCVTMKRLPQEMASKILARYRGANVPQGQPAKNSATPVQQKNNGVFAGFRGMVPTAIVDYCESVAHKPILVETYLQQCVNRDRLTATIAKQMMDHYMKNKPAAPGPQASQLPPDDGTLFGRFRGIAPDNVLSYCESVAHKPVLVETYLQQCINRGVLTIDVANQLMSYYHSNKPEPVSQSNPETNYGPSSKQRQEAMEFCTSCGQSVPSGSKFCCHCGSGLPILVPDENPRWECAKCRSQIPKNSNYCRKCGTPAVNPVIVNREDPVCGSCGTKLAPGSKFCYICGRPVEQNTGVRKVQTHCTNCGKPLSAGAKFCVYCGKPIQS